MKKILFALPLTLLIISCKSSLSGYSTKDGFTPDIYPHHELVNEIIKVKVDDSFTYEPSLKNITINSAVINKGLLLVSISHAGGCGDQNYELMYNGKGNTYYINQNSADDVCNADINKLIRFDLSSVNKGFKKPVKLVGFGKDVTNQK